MNTNKNVENFAQAVRTHLADLPTADVEELTEGLEADLAERIAEDGSDLGDPQAYAEELRSSAGFGTTAARLTPRASVSSTVKDAGLQLLSSVRKKPAGVAFIEFLVALRPIWWVLRGWVVFAIFAFIIGANPLLPRNLAEFLFWLLLVVLSVQWGRGRWLGTSAIAKTTKTVTSVVTAVLLVPLLALSINSIHNAVNADSIYYEPTSSMTGNGVVNNGNSVSNLFAYDCAGTPLSNIQLFDQNGRRLALAQDEETYIADTRESVGSDSNYLLPNRFSNAGGGWNVFPLEMTDANDPSEEKLVSRFPAPAPFPRAQPLLNECKPELPEITLPTTMPSDPTLEPDAVKESDATGATETPAADTTQNPQKPSKENAKEQSAPVEPSQSPAGK